MMTFIGGNDDATTSSFVYTLPGSDTSNQIGGKDQRLFNLVEGFAPLNYMKEIFSETKKFLADIEGAAVLLDSQFQEIVNTMGQGSNMAQSIKTELSEGTIEILKVGGKVTDAAEIQKNTVANLGRNVVLSSEEMSQFYNLTRATGVELKDLQEGFLDIGVSIHNIDDEMVKVIDVANSLGVSTKAVSKSVVDNLYQLNRFNFKDGVEGLAKMAAKASILRFDMGQTFDLADRMLDPQNAIEASAALQRLGATASSLTDPLQLMNLSQNNLPELQKQLGSLFQSYTQFDEKTGKFEIMPGARKQLKEVANSLNMDIKQVERLALGTADLDKKMSEIDFSGIQVEDETKELIASMATMKGGQYVVKVEDEQGKQQEKTIQQLIDEYQNQPDKLKEILQAQQSKEAQSPEEKMLSIATAQKDILTDIRSNLQSGAASITLQAGATVGQDILKLNAEISKVQSKSMQENFGPGSEYSKGLESASANLKLAAEDIKAGQYGDAAEKFGKAVIDFTTGAGMSAGQTIVDITTDFSALISVQDEVTAAIENLVTEIKSQNTQLGTVITQFQSFLGIKSEDAVIDPGNSIITTDAGGSLVKLLPDPQDLAILLKKTEIEKKQEDFKNVLNEKYAEFSYQKESKEKEKPNFEVTPNPNINETIGLSGEFIENFLSKIEKFKNKMTEQKIGKNEILENTIPTLPDFSSLIKSLENLKIPKQEKETKIPEKKETTSQPQLAELIENKAKIVETQNPPLFKLNLEIPKLLEMVLSRKSEVETKNIGTIVNQILTKPESNIVLNKPNQPKIQENPNFLSENQIKVQGGAVIEIKHDISIDSSKSPGINPQNMEKEIIKSFGQNNVMQKLKSALNDVYFGLEKTGTKNQIYLSNFKK